MWNNNEDVNENGEPVKLYMPVQAPPRKTNTAPQDSHIGGHHCFDGSFTPNCDMCQSQMFLLTQLRLKQHQQQQQSTPSDKYVLVFTCPHEGCFGQLVFDKGFSSGGGQGVVKCFEKRIDIADNEHNKIKEQKNQSTGSSWCTDSKAGGEDDNTKNDDDNMAYRGSA